MNTAVLKFLRLYYLSRSLERSFSDFTILLGQLAIENETENSRC